MKRLACLTTLACLLVLAACSSTSEELAGRPGGDETGNGLDAVVLDRQGAPVPNALVRVRPSWFLPGDSLQNQIKSGILDLKTGPDGRFHTDSLPLGKYLIESSDSSEGLLMDFEVGPGRRDLGRLQRHPLGDVWGQIELSKHMPACIRAWGLERSTFTDTSGNFKLGSMPPGKLRLLATDSASDSSLGESEVTIDPGFATKAPAFAASVSPETWNHQAWLDINLGSDGANLGGTVRDFAVLVRLDDSNFPFSQTRPDGSDLTAWSLSGKQIPLDIATWDPVGRKASAWIRMDSLQGSTTTSVKLIWGKGARNSQPVFDTARGWGGVWHFSQFLLDPQGHLRSPDATQWKQDAFLQGVGAGIGVISSGLLFTLPSDRVHMGSAGVQMGRHAYTWEAWVKTDKGYVVLMDKGNGDTLWESGEKKVLLGDRKYGMHGTSPGLVPSVLNRLNATTNDYENFSAEVTPDQWTHLAIRQTMAANDSVAVRWFVNGVADTGTTAPFFPENDDPRDSLWIGGIQNGGHLAMEELHISSISRSDAWIRLSYLNQMPSSRLVKIRSTSR
jgi:Concanavalin A-like lectin/glucanases superfamily